MNPDLNELLNYPDSKGKEVAMEHFNWMKLDKVQEVMYAKAIMDLAKKIDKSN